MKKSTTVLQVLALIGEGFAPGQISEQTGLSRSRVYGITHYYNTKARPRDAGPKDDPRARRRSDENRARIQAEIASGTRCRRCHLLQPHVCADIHP